MFKIINIQHYTNTDKGKMYVMSKKDEKKQNKIKPLWNRFWKNPIVLGTVPALIVAVGGAFINNIILSNVNKNEIANINENLTEIRSSINSLNLTSISTSNTVARHDGMLFAMLAVNGNLNTYSVEFYPEYNIETMTVENESYLAPPTWISTDIIAKDLSSDRLYEAIELCDIPIIVSYEENGKEIYFYGQYNDKNHWYGRCILNVYDDNKLETIFEGFYDDGSLLNYKRVSCDDGNTWIITDRINNIEYNSGETWIYTKTSDFTKEFTINTVTEKQILSVDNFLISKQEYILSYYCGNTSNGYYNDNTGYAYLITYFSPDVIDTYNNVPIIKTLYQGRFINGQFNDNSYDAWEIAREISPENNTTYMYYRGGFLNNRANSRNKQLEDFENYLTHEQIDEYLKQYGFSEYSNQFVTEYENQE